MTIGLIASPALQAGSGPRGVAGYTSAIADVDAMIRSGGDLSNFEPTVAA